MRVDSQMGGPDYPERKSEAEWAYSDSSRKAGEVIRGEFLSPSIAAGYFIDFQRSGVVHSHCLPGAWTRHSSKTPTMAART